MQITQLLIENVRAVERLELKLADDAGQPRRRVVLIGANGAGKTTILDAVAHAFKTLIGGWQGPGAKLLGAADVRNVEDPSLERAAPLRRGVIALDAVLSDDERRTSRRTYPKAPTAGSLRFEIGAGSNQSSEVDIFSVAQDQDDLPMSFEGPARAALSGARAPCILLPADRGVL